MESASIVLLPMNKICYPVSEYVPYFAMMGPTNSTAMNHEPPECSGLHQG
jgi:hypothetical protein